MSSISKSASQKPFGDEIRVSSQKVFSDKISSLMRYCDGKFRHEKLCSIAQYSMDQNVDDRSTLRQNRSIIPIYYGLDDYWADRIGQIHNQSDDTFCRIER